VARDIADRHPALQALLAEHIADNDELLPHVFFHDVTRWSEEEPQDSRELRQLLDQLDVCYRDGDDDVRNLLQVSYIEDLSRRPDILRVMGPMLRGTTMWEHVTRTKRL